MKQINKNRRLIIKINRRAHVFLLLALTLGLTSNSLWAVEDGLGTNVLNNIRIQTTGVIDMGGKAITNWNQVGSTADVFVLQGATNALNTAVTNVSFQVTNVLYGATNALNTAVTNVSFQVTNGLYGATNALNTAVTNLNANTTRWDNAMMIRVGVVGEAIAYSNLCYYKSSDSRWWKANATTNTTAQGLLGLALGTAISAGDPIPSAGLLINGYCTNAWGFAAGSVIYMDTNNGALTTNIPTGTNNIVRIVGYAINTTNIYFNPDRTFIEILGQE